jgi:two-component system CheB/CheR fusion protein
LRAIKAAGGHTIVEDPAFAEFKRMPEAAVATNCADDVLPLKQIGSALLQLACSDKGAQRG